MNGTSRVSLVRCDSYQREEVERQVNAAVAAVGGWEAFVKPGEKVLVKPNLLTSAPPEKAVTTHPEVLRVVILGCQKAGAEVWVGDSPGFGSASAIATRAGIMAVCQETGATFKPFTTVCETACPTGQVHKRFPLAEPVTAADKIISVAKLKTHGLTGYTGAVKNLYGTVLGTEKARLHLSYQTATDFGRMLMDLYSVVKPVLAVVDGVVGMEGAGPQNGTPRQIGAILAGADALAVDTVGAAIIGLPAARVPYLAAAHGRDLGETDLGKIEILGTPLAEMKISDYKLPASVGDRNALFGGWLGKLGRKGLASRPMISPELCIGCGVCKESCPPGAIEIREKRAHINDDMCIRCYCCQEMCPQAAIQLKPTALGRLFRWR